MPMMLYYREQRGRSIKMAMIMRFIFLFYFYLLLFFPGVLAYCECGYTFNSSVGGSLVNYVTTDLIESDFLHEKDVSKDTDWYIQGYTVTAENSRGTYGTNFTRANVRSNPTSGALNWTADGINGGLPGMQLVVGGGIPANGYVQTAEIDSIRTDLMYGSYRFLANLPSLNGTCSAMFDFYNNSQETDMEILSSQVFINGTHMANLVQQTQASAARGYSIPGDDYFVANLPFNPTNGFHEYRFDVVPGRIDFYQDQVLLGSLTAPAPVAGRHLILSHWSNGNPLWSGGPPAQDSTMTVGYVKAYFNSSDQVRQAAASARCQNPAAYGAYCPIPNDSLSANSLYSNFFYTIPNSTKGQTVYAKNEISAPVSLSLPAMAVVGLSIIMAMFS